MDTGTIDASGGSAGGTTGGFVEIESGPGLSVGDVITSSIDGTANYISIETIDNSPVTLAGLQAIGQSGSGAVIVTNSGTGGITAGGSIFGETLSLNATAGGNILLGNSAGDSINVQTNASVKAAGTITQFAGNKLSAGGTLTVQFGSGTPVLNTSVTSLVTTGSSAQTLTINESNAIQIGSQAIGQLVVNTAAGAITTGANIAGFNGLSLNAGAGATITLSHNITGNTNAEVSLNTANVSNASITQTAGNITTSGSGGVSVALNAGGSANLTSAGNSINNLNGIGGGKITLNNGSTALNLSTLGAAQSVNLTTTAATGITFPNSLSTTGTITLNTPRFFTNQSTTAASVVIQNPNGALTIAGAAGAGGSLTGTTPAAGPPGTPSIPTAIILSSANGAQLNLVGNMALVGDVTMNNFGGTTTAAAGALFHGTNNVTLNTLNYVQQGTPPQITGNNFVINISPFGTIINTAGDVNLNTNTTINGSDFAIVASGNINLGIMTINLSNGAGSGGNLTLLSGYSFTPASGGQILTSNPFTLVGPSLGGSINAADLTINTAATGAFGDGGDVLAVAQNGKVTLGTIDSSSASGIGGDVTVLGQLGLTVGAINASGLTSSGAVMLNVSVPAVTGTPAVTNGSISGGSFAGGALSTGSISARSIDGGIITIQGNSKKDIVLDTLKPQKNGVFGTMSGSEIHVANLGKGIKINNALGAGTVELVASLKGGISTNKDVVISAANLTLTAATGNIGKKDMLVSAVALQANTGGSVSLKNQLLAPTTFLLDSTAGKEFTLTTIKSVVLNDITTTAGNILVTGGTGGTLRVAAGSVITANNGAVTLINPDTTAGDILIGDNATVQTQGTKGKNTIISIGTAPKKPTITAEPANVTVNLLGGTAFFEGAPGGIIALGPTNAIVNVINKDVIFSNGSINSGAEKITLGSNAVITADPPDRLSTPSLPLKVTAVANAIDQQIALASPTFANGVHATPISSAAQVGLNTDNLTAAIWGNATQLSNGVCSLSTNLASSLVTIDEAELNTSVAQLDANNVAFNRTTDAEIQTSQNLFINAAFHGDASPELSSFAIEKISNVRLSEQSSAVGAKHKNGIKQLLLKNGNILFVPNVDTTVLTPHGKVKLAANSVALIMQSDNGLAVFDIDDHSKNAVVVESNDKKFSLSPGRHVVVSSHNSEEFSDVNPIELMQYRGLNRTNMSNGWKAYTSEFSIPSACYAVKPLHQLTASKHGTTAKIRNHMMKTSAVIMTLSPDRGDYVQFFKARATAYHRGF